ncbi:MAG TPA: hypothetical protein VEH06_05550 [Candidatus Bathyarchaeia archaeon]|nr:hypothetical protein [Candidatus Bathyarchaeia archaeon]
MRRLFVFGTAIVFAVAIIMITILYNRFILLSTTAAQEQQINSNPNVLIPHLLLIPSTPTLDQ